jgi:hypothetical protein
MHGTFPHALPRFHGEHIDFKLSDDPDAAGGKRWSLTLHGRLLAEKTFTTDADLRRDLEAILAQHRQERAPEQAQEQARPEPSQDRTEPRQEEEPRSPPQEPSKETTPREDVAMKAFRPIPVERPPLPSWPDCEKAIVRVVDTYGPEGAVLEVVELTKGFADLRTLLRRDLAVFPRLFDAGELKKGQRFAVESVQGFDKDPNAQKIRRLLGEMERSLGPLARPTVKQVQERRQEPELTNGL